MNLLLIIYFQDLKVEKLIGIMLLQLVHDCNVKKGGKLIKILWYELKSNPISTIYRRFHRNGKNFPPNFLHKSWMDYLYWDVELEA